jgi:hypothetical protein
MISLLDLKVAMPHRSEYISAHAPTSTSYGLKAFNYRYVEAVALIRLFFSTSRRKMEDWFLEKLISTRFCVEL